MSQEGDERHKTKRSWGKRRGRSQTPLDDPNCMLAFHLRGAWSSTQLSRWERGKKSGKPGVKLSTRQKWNEDHQWELPPPTKTHLNLTCMKHSKLRRWANFHSSSALSQYLLRLRWTLSASSTCDEDTCHEQLGALHIGHRKTREQSRNQPKY